MRRGGPAPARGEPARPATGGATLGDEPEADSWATSGGTTAFVEMQCPYGTAPVVSRSLRRGGDGQRSSSRAPSLGGSRKLEQEDRWTAQRAPQLQPCSDDLGITRKSAGICPAPRAGTTWRTSQEPTMPRTETAGTLLSYCLILGPAGRRAGTTRIHVSAAARRATTQRHLPLTRPTRASGLRRRATTCAGDSTTEDCPARPKAGTRSREREPAGEQG